MIHIDVKITRRHYKCSFNSDQRMTVLDVLGCKYRCSYGINPNRKEIMQAIPVKKQEDYDPKFIDWFVNFHAKRLHIQDWEKFPNWMIPLLKRRAEEIHEGFHFSN